MLVASPPRQLTQDLHVDAASGLSWGRLTSQRRREASRHARADARHVPNVRRPRLDWARSGVVSSSIGTLVSLAAPLLPYLTGAWETLWFDLARTFWPLPLRAVAIFLLGLHLALSRGHAAAGYYGGYVVPHAFGLGRQSRARLERRLAQGDAAGGAARRRRSAACSCGSSSPADRTGGGSSACSSRPLGMVLVFVTPYVLVPLFFKMRPLADAATVERIHALVNRAGAPVARRVLARLLATHRRSQRRGHRHGPLAAGRHRRHAAGRIQRRRSRRRGRTRARPPRAPRRAAAAAGQRGADLGWVCSSRRGCCPARCRSSACRAWPMCPATRCCCSWSRCTSCCVSPLLNWWSRRLESGADRFALQLTRDPAAFAGAMQRLGCQNLVELCPPRWSEVLLATHPALQRRIQLARRGVAERCHGRTRRRQRRPVGPPPLALRLAAVLAVPLLLYALVTTGQKALDNYRLNQEADAPARRDRRLANAEHRSCSSRSSRRAPTRPSRRSRASSWA